VVTSGRRELRDVSEKDAFGASMLEFLRRARRIDAFLVRKAVYPLTTVATGMPVAAAARCPEGSGTRHVPVVAGIVSKSKNFRTPPGDSTIVVLEL
jgi:hypothetical protein